MIPAVVLTGFLGAGKTTTLNGLMAAAPELRVGVIENEAGQEGIDGDLLAGAARVVDVVGGCACCTVRGALTSALELLAERADELDLIVIETSGIADPVPIVQALQVPVAHAAMRLSAIVCVVDAATVAADDVPPRIWARQLHFADSIVVTKSDLIAEHNQSTVYDRIREQAPDATILSGLHEPATRERLVTVPGTAPAVSATEPADPGHGFTAHSLRIDRDLDPVALDAWASTVLRRPGVLRIKGTIAVAGLRRRYVIQATPAQLRTYVEDSTIGLRKSRLVVIGTDLDADELQAGLERCALDPVPTA